MSIAQAQAAWHAALSDSDNHEREHGCMPTQGRRWPACHEAGRLRNVEDASHRTFSAMRLAAEVAA